MIGVKVYGMSIISFQIQLWTLPGKRCFLSSLLN